jgi:hypothetical protein
MGEGLRYRTITEKELNTAIGNCPWIDEVALPISKLEGTFIMLGVCCELEITPDCFLDTIDRIQQCPAKQKYMEYLVSPHWQELRVQTIAERGNKCERCGGEVKIDLHHKTYKNKGHEKPEDLILLCRKCHEKQHTGGK